MVPDVWALADVVWTPLTLLSIQSAFDSTARGQSAPGSVQALSADYRPFCLPVSYNS